MLAGGHSQRITWSTSGSWTVWPRKQQFGDPFSDGTFSSTIHRVNNHHPALKHHQNVRRWSHPEDHVIYVRLLDGMALEAIIWWPLQQRYLFLDDSLSKISPEHHQSVGRWSLLENNVIYVRFLDGMASEATIWWPLQRRHLFLDDSLSKSSPEHHQRLSRCSHADTHVIYRRLLEAITSTATSWWLLQPR